MSTALKDRLNGKLSQAQTTELAEGRVITMPTNTSLSPSDTGYIALTTNALDIISENLKNQPLSHGLFDIVKSPSGGATVFSVPGISGEEAEKELTGIILAFTTPRAYWETAEPVEGEPPICFSRDSLVSHEGKPCSRCQFNDFGSKNGGDSNGKACKESVLLYLLRPDNIIPLIVRVPVSSKLIFLRYTTRLVSSLTPISGVVTRITLEKATSKQGKPYALYNFEAVSTLTPEEAANAKAYGQKFVELLNTTELDPMMAEAS
jgi:hypothetical protein